ncbi:MAG: choice-of-anchor J domain-containing protein [Prevotellaceae bacterium]|jgi:hypothetical protein|nr:choice-of-anchor J domain-containing protein [Prevotellaceae bacterium]
MKKLRLILSMVCLSVFGLIAYQADAQQTRGGTPPTFLVKEAQALPAQAYVKLPVNFSISELLEEDEFNAKNGIIRPRVAKSISSNITMENSGKWDELPDGRKIWRVAIEAKNAKAIILGYDDFYLPEGSQLFIYNADKTHVLGAYDYASNLQGGTYSTAFVAGDVSILEYVAPLTETVNNARIKISSVGYGYNHIHIVPKTGNDLQVSPNTSLSCQVNVICSEGDLYREQIKSVCHLLMLSGGSWYICSGTLINNTVSNGKPYIISAYHCYEGTSASELLQWQFYFFYESAVCESNTGYVTNQYLTGAYLRSDVSISGGSDGLLLELVNAIPVEWINDGKVSFAGWRRTLPPTTTKGVGIHHPQGDTKKILTYDGITISQWNGSDGSVGAANAHIQIYPAQTEHGWSQTEGGSSGSGLFDEDGYLIGTLTGGTSANCSSGSRSLYGGLFYHWDHGSGGGMGEFLDPDGSGDDECPPFPNTTTANFVSSSQNIYALESVKFSAVIHNIDSVSWEFQGGVPATSTLMQPIVKYDNPGDYDVKMTAYGKSDVTGNDTVIVVNSPQYIHVTIKGGASAAAPVANLAVGTDVSTVIFSDDGNGSTTARVGTTNASTAKWLKEGVSGSPSNTVIDNNWRVLNTGDPCNSGYGGNGDYFIGNPYVSGTYEVRLFNRVPFDFTGYASGVLKFRYYRKVWAFLSNNMDGLYVQYRASSSSSWTLLQTVATRNGAGVNDAWSDEISITLPNLSSDYQIAFVRQSSAGDGLAIDNIVIEGINQTMESHVTIWEGDAVNYYDLSTGVPVFYKYDFEGGEPATSTSTTSPIPVQYNTEGLYDASQWVKNTFGEDSIKLDDYVTVLHRELKSDKDEIYAECGDALVDTVVITSNRSWSITSIPAWITAVPNSHTHTGAEGTEESTEVIITVSANTGYQARLGGVVFTSDDGKVRTVVTVNQSTDEVPGLTAVVVPDNNAQITWNRLPGMPLPPSPCDAKGDFEDVNNYTTFWTTFTETGNTSPGWRHYSSWTGSSPLSLNSPGIVFCESFNNDVGAYVANAYLVTPKLQITSANHLLKYWIASQDPSYLDGYEVLLSETDAHSSAAAFTETIKSWGSAPGNWTEVTIDLTSYIGQEVYIAFHHKDEDMFILLLDNVSGLELANCASGVPMTKNAEKPMLSLENAVIIDAAIAKKIVSSNGDIEKLNEEQQTIQEKIAYLKEHPELTKSTPLFSERVINKQNIKRNNLVKLQSATAQDALTPQATDVSELIEMKWADFDDPYSSVGATGTTFKVAAKWPTAEAKAYKDYALRAMRIAVADPTADITLFVMEGSTEIYTQHVGKFAMAEDEYVDTVIDFDYPVIISGNADLYIGYSIAGGYSGYPSMRDAMNPGINGKGDVIYFNGAWYTIPDLLSNSPFGNWMIAGYAEKPKPSGFSVYRQRHGTTVTGDWELIATGLVDTTYFDEDIRPGGKYCYYVTYTHINLESCPSDTGCVFIMYKQDVNKKVINKEYGDDRPFDLELKNTAEDIDYFEGRLLPFDLTIESGTSITISGAPNDYSADILSAGLTELKAVLHEIPDTLLPDTVYIKVNVAKHDLYVTAVDKEREYGKDNPALTYTYNDFVYGETEANLAQPPQVSTNANRLSPIGEYKIAVTVFEDLNYNLIPVDGVLRVVRNEDRVDVFTPYDQNNINDRFMPDYKLKVFNRYGVLIYETENVSQKVLGWDGRFKNSNQLVDPGVYYYVAYDAITGKVIRKGSVTVVKK